MALRKVILLASDGSIEEIPSTDGLSLALNSDGYVLFNTTDQTTNYERLRIYRSGNVYYLVSENGGTGTIRGIQLSGGNAGVGIGGAPLSGNALNVTGQANFNNNTYFQQNINCNGVASMNGGNPGSSSAYDLGSTSRIWNNLYVNKIYTSSSGQSTQSGNGSATSFTITHGLTGITSASKVFITARSSAAVGFGLVSVNSTQITISYMLTPASGTNNLVWDWFIIP